MDHESIAKKHAENIMQRVNDTYPRTLNIDVLVDEIGKAVREATKNQHLSMTWGDFADMITPDHDKSSSKLPWR